MIALKENDWLIREAEPQDLNFIYSTWLNSYKHDSQLGKSTRTTVFFNSYPNILDTILERSKVIVAYFEKVPSVILSYLVYDDFFVHYLFTKEVYRKNGIASSLFLQAFHLRMSKGVPIYYSHRTFTSEPIIGKYESYLSFNPFTLYKQSEGEPNVRT